jgi:hypothetical protein
MDPKKYFLQWNLRLGEALRTCPCDRWFFACDLALRPCGRFSLPSCLGREKFRHDRNSWLDPLQRGCHIGDEIVGVFDADGVADQIVFDAYP